MEGYAAGGGTDMAAMAANLLMNSGGTAPGTDMSAMGAAMNASIAAYPGYGYDPSLYAAMASTMPPPPPVAATPAPTAGTASATSNKVFIGGLPKKTTTEQTVWTYFGQFGTVTDVTLKYDQATNEFRGFGFVTFQTVESASAVLANYNNNTIDGKWIEVKAAETNLKGGGGGKGGKDGKDAGKGGGKFSKGGGKVDNAGGKGGDEGNKIFVGGLPKTVNDQTMWTWGAQFGTVTEVSLKYDQETGGFRGFGFVTFSSSDAVAAVLANSANNMVDGKWVEVKAADASKKGGGGKGGKDGGKGGGKGGAMSAPAPAGYPGYPDPYGAAMMGAYGAGYMDPYSAAMMGGYGAPMMAGYGPMAGGYGQPPPRFNPW